MTKKVSIEMLQKMKTSGEKIACLTSYDASFGKLQDEAGVDVLLIGDSLGTVLHGDDSTRNVTMEDMIYHCRLVSKVCQRALIICDMPFESYLTPEQGLGNARRLVEEAGADVVKLEGGTEIKETISAIKQAGISVCGHLGLTPQSVSSSEGYRVQATTDETAEKLKQDALAIQEAGVDCLVFECIPAGLAKVVTELLDVPTIGIGAGVDCDGQVLVVYDMLGLTGKQFKFCKDFLGGKDSIADAIEAYVNEVKSGIFPSSENSFQ